MQVWELYLIWGCIYVYSFISALLLVAFIFNKSKLLNIIRYALMPSFVTHTVIFVYRWYATGYFPANGDFENAMTGTWFAVALTVALFFSRKELRGVGLVTMPSSVLLLGYGIMADPGGQPLAVSLKSSWLVIHVLFAQLAFGAYLVASGLGLIYILKDRTEKTGRENQFFNRFPALPIIDEIMFKFVIFGFIADAIMIGAGSIWAKDLWGSYWNWDPVEIWSLLSWLIYGFTIHLKVTFGWKGRKLAWIFIFAVLGIVITYWGINLFVDSTQHVFRVRSNVQ